MNRHEAKQLLDHHLAELRRLSYHELENRIRERRTHAAEIAPPSGKKYQLEEDVRWDDRSKGTSE